MIDFESMKRVVEEVLVPPVQLYSLKVKKSGNNTLIEVDLDNIEHKFGSVTLGDCEDVARKIQSKLDETEPSAIYTLNVSSAGAERELKLPSDLHRFKELPIRLAFQDGEGKSWNHVVKVKEIEGDDIIVETYSSKKAKQKSKIFTLKIKDILKGNLYLDI
ncbi:MAG: ribosome maturation factor RimP [Leptospiraceae bacterium]|nr:ribosome maturation factor RimP [Leptospiraceae bacterium]MCP5513231.1 ribosome maturation factor RimP [Leptospiraceae bacterium]